MQVIRILIAEDEMLEMKYLKKILTAIEHFEVVYTSTNGKDAVDYAKEHPVDIAILDIKMPIMSGLQATEVLKSLDETIKIIINTAYAEFELAQKALHFGADEYIIKPIKDYMLVELIDNLYNRKNNKEQLAANCSEHYNLADYPLIEEKTLINAMQHFDIKLFKRSYSDFVHTMMVSAKGIASIRYCLQDFISELSRTMIHIGFEPSEIDHFKSTNLQKLDSANSIHALQTLLTDIEKLLSDKMLLFDSSAFYQTKNIIRYIQNNFQESITLKSLSQQFHFSESYLSRCINKETNMSFPQYLNQLRIDHARHLLKNSNMKISEIATEVGYHDTSHFNRTFKSYTNYTPTHYRTLIGNEEN